MLSEDIKTEIQNSYSRFLSAQGWRARYGQKLMIAEIAKAIGAIDTDSDGKRITDGSHIAVIEAGTGIGKTVAYLTALIPIAKAMKKKIVVSTATVALQDQLVKRDIPNLLKHAQISSRFVLAKGRGRYACNANLQRWASSAVENQQLSLLAYFEEATASASAEEVDGYSRMYEALQREDWSGDRDSWPETMSDPAWFRLTSDHSKCSGRACDFYDECVFHRARERVFAVDIVVANHDLVLADLAMGGGSILPAPEETLYVFDEAHHLPAKALAHFNRQTRLNGSLQWLDECESLVADAAKLLPLKPGHVASLGDLKDRLSPVRHAIRSVLQWCKRAVPVNHSGEPGRLRFPLGCIDESLQEAVQLLSDHYAHMVGAFSGVCNEVSGWFERDPDNKERGLADVWAPVMGMARQRLESDMQLWVDFARTDESEGQPWARWVTELTTSKDHDFLVNCSPVQSNEQLQHHVWNRCFGAVLTSATLSVNQSFDQFFLQAGLKEQTVAAMVPSPFDYASVAELHVPRMTSRAADAPAHTQELIDRIPDLLRLSVAGHLVIFASRKQMQAVFEALPLEEKEHILCQGDYPKFELLKRHCEKIDGGERSVIFGLASFAEGIDLPGAYCQQVIIAKLPFAVPDDPVIATLSEWLESKGHDPFTAVTVPECAIKLKQAVGRLIRSESDWGRVVILDDRIVTKHYGKTLLNSLPAMKQVRKSWQMLCES